MCREAFWTSCCCKHRMYRSGCHLLWYIMPGSPPMFRIFVYVVCLHDKRYLDLWSRPRNSYLEWGCTQSCMCSSWLMSSCDMYEWMNVTSSCDMYDRFATSVWIVVITVHRLSSSCTILWLLVVLTTCYVLWLLLWCCTQCCEGCCCLCASKPPP